MDELIRDNRAPVRETGSIGAGARWEAMPRKILIVEDDVATRVGLQELVSGAGYAVVAASDFREGRRALETEHPDALIVDLRLQGFNGLQLLHVAPRPIPTVVVTGFPDDVLQADARKLGAEYLVKPVEPARLLDVLRRLLQAGDTPHDRRRFPRRPVAVDVPVEINGVPARVTDASRTGVGFEIYRPVGHAVPRDLRLVFPVHELELDAALVWSHVGGAGRWQCGANLSGAGDRWTQLLDTAAGA
jgi:CheY-like chemotaxis protein